MNTRNAQTTPQLEPDTTPVSKQIHFAPQQSSVYILSSVNDVLLYIGHTDHLQSKVWLHKKRTTDHLGLTFFEQKLVHVEQFSNPIDACAREQELTRLPEIELRKLITTNNPNWEDLFDVLHPNYGSTGC